jgi:hypothetical protein
MNHRIARALGVNFPYFDFFFQIGCSSRTSKVEVELVIRGTGNSSIRETVIYNIGIHVKRKRSLL